MSELQDAYAMAWDREVDHTGVALQIKVKLRGVSKPPGPARRRTAAARGDTWS